MQTFPNATTVIVRVQPSGLLNMRDQQASQPASPRSLDHATVSHTPHAFIPTCFDLPPPGHELTSKSTACKTRAISAAYNSRFTAYSRSSPADKSSPLLSSVFPRANLLDIMNDDLQVPGLSSVGAYKRTIFVVVHQLSRIPLGQFQRPDAKMPPRSRPSLSRPHPPTSFCYSTPTSRLNKPRSLLSLCRRTI